MPRLHQRNKLRATTCCRQHATCCAQHDACCPQQVARNKLRWCNRGIIVHTQTSWWHDVHNQPCIAHIFSQGWKRWVFKVLFFYFFKPKTSKGRFFLFYGFLDIVFLSVPLLYHSMGQIIKSVFLFVYVCICRLMSLWARLRSHFSTDLHEIW